jgi:hypothetical protein
MSTLAQTIKDGIRRISRREIGLALSKFRRDHIALKKKLADLINFSSPGFACLDFDKIPSPFKVM